MVPDYGGDAVAQELCGHPNTNMALIGLDLADSPNAIGALVD
jgi:hypothetical protein